MNKSPFISGILLSILLLVWNPCQSQEITYNIEEYSLQNGYNLGVVKTMFESDNGLIWLGTSTGLFRFDGHDFKHWNKHDNEILFDIRHIVQDDEGLLWVCNETLFDLVFFDPHAEVFITKREKFGDTFPEIRTNKSDKGMTIGIYGRSGKIKDGSLIFNSFGNNYIYKYHSKAGFSKVAVAKDLHELMAVNDYLWFTGKDNKIVRCDLNGNELNRIKLEEYATVNSIYEIGNRIFASSAKVADGVYDKNIYELDDHLNKELVSNHSDYKRHTTTDYLISIVHDKWIVRNYNNDIILTLDKSHFVNENLIHNEYIFEDGRGSIWIYGHYGIVNLTLVKNKFRRLLNSSDGQSVGAPTRGIFVDQDNFYIACEAGQGLKVIGKENYSNIKTIGNAQDSWPKPLIKLSAEEIAYGNYYLNIYNKNTNKTETFKTSPTDINAWGIGHGLWSIYLDDEGDIWSGVGDYLAVKRADSDSVVYHEASEIFKLKKASSTIQNIIPEGKDSLWLCSLSGLYLFDLRTEKIVAEYNETQNEENYLPAESFYYLYKDKDKYWLGTRSGLIEWNGPNDPQNYNIYTSREKLSNNVIYAIIEDDYNRLWLSSDYGIMAFDKNDHSVSTYLEKDGIAHYECNRLSQFKDDEGYIYFGGLNGVTRFHPKDFIAKESDNPELLLTGFRIFDGEKEKEIDRKGKVLASNTIDFNPKDRFFKLEFTLPTYGDISQTTYAWKIDGIDKEWNYQKENTVQVGMLPYGKHNLRIKAKTTSGLKSKRDLELMVIVHKPFYLKWWFVLGCILTLLGLIYTFFLWRTNMLKSEIDKATRQISEDKETIEHQAEELKKLDKLKSRFFANVSHELRTPLSLMVGPIQRLKKIKGLTDNDEKLLGFLDKSTIHLKKLVSEILDLSKLESNKMTLETKPTKIKAFIVDLLSQYHSLGEQSMVGVQSIIEIDEDVVLEVDQPKFQKLLGNYLSNAIKYSGESIEVLLKATLVDDQLEIAVKDFGQGIAKADLPYVFDRFYQARNASLVSEGGTGIGLSMCKELGELMGGKVWAKSELGRGSTFYFKAPFTRSTLAVQDHISSSIKDEAGVELESILLPFNKKDKTILIAEDNPDLRAYYQIILEAYTLHFAEHGGIAIQKLQEGLIPDLIISDLMMPVMDGMQLIEQVKSTDGLRQIPFVMLTAKTNQSVKIKALRYGIDDYLTKPFDEEELNIRISNLLSFQEVRKEGLKEDKKMNEQSLDLSLDQKDLAWISELESLILNHLGSDLLSIPFLATKVNMSESSLLRYIKRITGLTPSKYLTEIRLNHAKELLHGSQYANVSEVAYNVGYRDQSAFSRSFKKRFGISPSEILN